MKSISLPFTKGRLLWVPERHDAIITADEMFATNLRATHFDGDGKIKHEHDLGSGLITNVGMTSLANDFGWAAGFNLLSLAKYMATGTGATAAAATDITLQTIDAVAVVTGTQSLVSAANLQKYQVVGTMTGYGTEAVTEWGLFTSATTSATTGSPLTAVSGTSATATGTPFTASSSSVRGEQQYIIRTTTTASYGLITSNSTSVLNIPAWYKVADGTAGTTPGSTEAYTIYPVMLDHKVFSAINTTSGDSIQFTYSLTAATGG